MGVQPSPCQTDLPNGSYGHVRMAALQIGIVRIVGLAVILPGIYDVVLIQIGPVVVLIGLHIVHQEGLEVVGQLVAVAVVVRDAIPVLVLPRKHPVRILPPGVHPADRVGVHPIGVTVVIVVVVHHGPHARIVLQPTPHTSNIRMERPEGRIVVRPDGEGFAREPEPFPLLPDREIGRRGIHGMPSSDTFGGELDQKRKGPRRSIGILKSRHIPHHFPSHLQSPEVGVHMDPIERYPRMYPHRDAQRPHVGEILHIPGGPGRREEIGREIALIVDLSLGLPILQLRHLHPIVVPYGELYIHGLHRRLRREIEIEIQRLPSICIPGSLHRLKLQQAGDPFHTDILQHLLVVFVRRRTQRRQVIPEIQMVRIQGKIEFLVDRIVEQIARPLEVIIRPRVERTRQPVHHSHSGLQILGILLHHEVQHVRPPHAVHPQRRIEHHRSPTVLRRVILHLHHDVRGKRLLGGQHALPRILLRRLVPVEHPVVHHRPADRQHPDLPLRMPSEQQR